MNEHQSRLLDFWIGIPLCWLLTRWRRWTDWLRGRAEPAPPRRVLFIKLAEMGAIALAMPAFEAARRRVGRENLFCLVLAPNRDIHDLIDFFPRDNVWCIRDDHPWTFARDVWNLMRRCRAAGIDTIIDLEGFARVSAMLGFLSGARTRVGFHRYTSEGLYRGDLLTHRVTFNYYLHASRQFLSLVEALDHAPDADVLIKDRVSLDDYRLPQFTPTPAESSAIEAKLVAAFGSVPAGPLLVLNPNLTDLLPLRRWPRDSFLQLGRQLLEQHPRAAIVLVGLPRERNLSRELAREISPDRACSLAGETTLRELVALFGRAALLVTSDSGPGHMAAFTSVPIVSLFGPETPQLYAPLSPHNLSVWQGLACSPCLHAFNHRRSPCQGNVCMTSISVAAALAAAKEACPALRSGDPASAPAANSVR